MTDPRDLPDREAHCESDCCPFAAHCLRSLAYWEKREWFDSDDNLPPMRLKLINPAPDRCRQFLAIGTARQIPPHPATQKNT